MKRINHLTAPIADPDNLRLAFWKASKGKRYAKQVLAYGKELDRNLLKLRSQILVGEVEVGNYYSFKIFDPKEREICASAFSEQVLHHAMMNVCDPYFEQKQIYDSYACRRGKGTYAAIDRAKIFTRKYAWYLKLDVRKYFGSIHHQVLKDQLGCMFKDTKVLSIFGQIIDSYHAQPDRGLPIGNLASQYFANHYLSGLDHFIKEQLRIKAYTRYMDDMILWHTDKAVLQDAYSVITSYIEDKLQCSLKPEQLNKTKYGLPFLGYVIHPYHVRLTQRSKKRFVKKLRHIDKKYHSGEWSEAKCQRKVLPLLAFILHADTQNLRKSVILR